MWCFHEDKTSPVITAKRHIESGHKNKIDSLPQTAVLFFMHSGVEFVRENYKTELIVEKFPRFLHSCPIYKAQEENEFCFLDGGAGAPQAVDTLETLSALGVKNVVSVGMCGVFSAKIQIGNIIIPDKAFIEEGTSLHYYPDIEYSLPDNELLYCALKNLDGSRALPIVSTDAVYRQTFYKENLWRSKGAVGVDMETSALYSVSSYLGVKTVSVLIASDKHPLASDDTGWKWEMTTKIRHSFFEKCISFAFKL